MPLQSKNHKQQTKAIQEKQAVAYSKKWQKLFRSPEQREKAAQELVALVHLVRDLATQSDYSPEWILDGNGEKIYL